tara:strand:- start:4151 stop:4678 length:528 start_codon:yes stop_codon:yes gene_type:complete
MKQIGDTVLPHKVYDDFLEPDYFKKLVEIFMDTDNCSWYFSTKVGTKTEIENLNNFYFIHTLYNHHQPRSDLLIHLDSLIKKLNVKALMRAKANLFTRTEKKHEFDLHQDLPFEANSAVFSLNSCDGGTILEHENRKIEINSVANRLLLFKSNISHKSTTCTNRKFRMNLNLIYF